jgi:H+/Cl- antiporter ClcA
MLMSALVIGALVAYYFGLRAGVWAAVLTFVLCVAALALPRFALPLYVALAAGAVVVQQIGSRRPRPSDSLMATRLARRAVGRAWGRLMGKRDRDGDR